MPLPLFFKNILFLLLRLIKYCTYRGQDIQTKKQHIPLVDRTPLEPPPVMVAVVGPPKVGKTTLIHALIRNFTRQPLAEIKGPVTIVSGTFHFIACNASLLITPANFPQID